MYSCYLNQFKSAFSLVELSIVLIIIGLLISAVIGGRALIDEAKIIGIKNEFESIYNGLKAYSQDNHIGGQSQCFDQTLVDAIKAGYIDKKFMNDNGYSCCKSKLGNKFEWYPHRVGCGGNEWLPNFRYGRRINGMHSMFNDRLCEKAAKKLNKYYADRMYLFDTDKYTCYGSPQQRLTIKCYKWSTGNGLVEGKSGMLDIEFAI